jgi:hypothetical protein
MFRMFRIFRMFGMFGMFGAIRSSGAESGYLPTAEAGRASSTSMIGMSETMG